MASDGLPDVGRMRVLREVGLRGSIAGAARSLGLTSSAVSQQLSLLEREAGTALVYRSSRGVALTGAGRVLAARAGEVVDVLAAARADLDRLAGAVSGPVRVAAVASAAVGIVSGAVRALAADHADLDIAVTVAEPAQSLAWLAHGDADVAVVDEYDFVPLALPDFAVGRELCAEPLVLTVPADAPLTARLPRRPALADLADVDWVLPPEEAACGQAVRAACRTAGFEPRVRWTSDDMLVLARAVAEGHGVSVLPRLSVAGEVAGVRLDGVDVRPLSRPALQRRLTAVARSTGWDRPAIATVVAALARASASHQPRGPRPSRRPVRPAATVR